MDRRGRRRKHRPVLLSITVGNVSSLPNKMDELTALTRQQREYWSCIELLSVSMRPHYLPQEFSHVITIAAYVPPSANDDAANEVLHSVTSRLQTEHPQALLLISGDFNHASPSFTLPTFTQYVTCSTRDNKTLDFCYANTTGA